MRTGGCGARSVREDRVGGRSTGDSPPWACEGRGGSGKEPRDGPGRVAGENPSTPTHAVRYGVAEVEAG